MEWRLIDLGLKEPAFTAAADEAVSLAVSRGDVPNTLHFYRRSRPTISLGYFQEVGKAIDLGFCGRHGIDIVRRVSGGSAIYTDPGHLIYSLAVDENMLPKDRNRAFEMVCGAIVSALGELGVEAEFKPVNDVLVNGRKISGSAQMRRRGIVLQHGTIVLDNDNMMLAGALKQDLKKIEERGQGPESYVTSLKGELGRETEPGAVIGALAVSLGRLFKAEFRDSQLSEMEKDTIRRLILEKYSRAEWNLRR